MATPLDPSSEDNDNLIKKAEEEVEPATAETADTPTVPADQAQAAPWPITSADQLPPEARGEVNGGPLGCCLGTMIGLLLSISVPVISWFYADKVMGGGLTVLIRVAMALVAVVCVILCSRFGWIIGTKVYREYEPPVIKQRGKQPAAKPQVKRRSR